MTSTNDVVPSFESTRDTSTKIFLILENTIVSGFKEDGINHKNVLMIFSNICKELDVNNTIKKEIVNDTGNNKAIIAIQVIQYALTKYLDLNYDKINDQEKYVIDFFLSDNGELILMATTSIIVKTFDHIKKAYNYADMNNDGCLCGKKECKTFWRKLFCLKTK